jgi:hypothetical protein
MPVLRILWLFTAFFGLCFELNAQQNKDAKQKASSAENLLSVGAEVVAQNYCHDYDDMFTVSMDLKLRFTNVSGHPVILSKKIESPNVVRAARDAEAGKKGDFLYNPDPHFAVAELPKSPAFKNAPDSKLFVILNAGESFETLVHTGVFAAKGEATSLPVHGLLSNGSYVLQVGVWTWPYEWPYFEAKTDSQELKQRWAKYGELSAGLVYSDFVPFAIPEHFNNPRCK